MGGRSLRDLVHPTWLPALAAQEATFDALNLRLSAESAAGQPWLPARPLIMRAFEQPLPDIRVLIVGQDPYPTPGHPVGLSFSVSPDVSPLPRSLANIYRELTADLDIDLPRNGDLSPWTHRGVMLLNRVLTVAAGQPGSHRGWGWEAITDAAVTALADRGDSLVAILWGRDAQAVAPLLGGVPIIASAHPSPMSAARGFFGSRPFSRANLLLQEAGAQPIDWSLPT